MLCENCGNQMVSVVGPVITKFNFESLVLDDIPHYKCPECGFVGYSFEQAGDLSRKAASMYRDIHGLLTAEEIHDIREGMGIGIRLFAMLLGVSESTTIQWENDVLVQTTSDDAGIRKLADRFLGGVRGRTPLLDVDAREFGFLPCPFGCSSHFPVLSVLGDLEVTVAVKCKEHHISIQKSGESVRDLIAGLRDKWNSRYSMTDEDIRDAKLDAAAFDADEDWEDKYVIG